MNISSKTKVIIENLKKGVVKETLPIATLCLLDENQSLNGNQIRLMIGKNTGVALSPAFFYLTLRALEAGGFVIGHEQYKAKTFKITEEGIGLLEESEDMCKLVNLLISKLLPLGNR